MVYPQIFSRFLPTTVLIEALVTFSKLQYIIVVHNHNRFLEGKTFAQSQCNGSLWATHKKKKT